MNRPTRLAAPAAVLMATCLLAPGITAHEASGGRLAPTATRPGTAGGGTRTTLLLRDPPPGHPKAAEASVELASFKGHFSRPGDSGTLCPLIHAPVRASAPGRWNGRRTDARADVRQRVRAACRGRGRVRPGGLTGKAGWRAPTHLL
ncbi:SSI family serine proteinase inhibitor [Streptomyces griseoluteus]|uniref:SSI family serine proteinase inhibitor n=1 Tax=Streptomyces griseoluteus TaxID=29306 RepID=UPI00369B1E29